MAPIGTAIICPLRVVVRCGWCARIHVRMIVSLVQGADCPLPAGARRLPTVSVKSMMGIAVTMTATAKEVPSQEGEQQNPDPIAGQPSHISLPCSV